LNAACPRAQQIAVVLLLSIMTVTVACGSSSSTHGSTGISQVLASAACPPELCVPLDAAKSQLGFQVLQPTQLPDGFSLHARTLLRESAPPGPQASGPPAPDPSGRPTGVLLDYRYKDSPNVPGITISEIQIGRNDPSGAPPLHLELSGPNCGESVTLDHATVFYVHGVAGVQMLGGGTLNVCKTEDRDAHYAAITVGNVLVEVLAFSETNVSKDDVMRIAGSLQPAE
jgi:hypothetical protein